MNQHSPELALADGKLPDGATHVAEPIADLEKPKCEQCGKPFDPRKGGKAQRFCSEPCRMAFHAGVREAGKVVTQAKGATCTLLAPTPEPAKPEPALDGSLVDFDWGDTEAVVLREQPATALYFNGAGELVIRQQRWPDDDPVIFIAPQNLMEFIDKLTEACGVPSVGKARQ